MTADGGAAVRAAGALAGRRRAETLRGSDLRLVEWETAALACGITTAAAGDFSVSGNPTDALMARYAELAERLGFSCVAVPRQVHGTGVRVVEAGWTRSPGGGPAAPPLLLAGRVDGLVTRSAGLLLASTAADCVPVYLHCRTTGLVGLAHAGWRGVAGGILGAAVGAMVAEGAVVDDMEVHLGPAICGDCYEVDRPVLEALGLPGDRARVDLRGLLVGQAREAGVPGTTASTHCTRCDASRLHSHRGSGGQAGRMAAFIGVRHP